VKRFQDNLEKMSQAGSSTVAIVRVGKVFKTVSKQVDDYIQSGYEIFGILDNCPKFHKRHYIKKVSG
jgi:hypothetical protein